MKRLVALLLAATMVSIMLVGCGKEQKIPPENSQSTHNIPP
ncbi:MAG: hypothetical protein RR315_00375 [Oscillospiraceae bacterium]